MAGLHPHNELNRSKDDVCFCETQQQLRVKICDTPPRTAQDVSLWPEFPLWALLRVRTVAACRRLNHSCFCFSSPEKQTAGMWTQPRDECVQDPSRKGDCAGLDLLLSLLPFCRLLLVKFCSVWKTGLMRLRSWNQREMEDEDEEEELQSFTLEHLRSMFFDFFCCTTHTGTEAVPCCISCYKTKEPERFNCCILPVCTAQ